MNAMIKARDMLCKELESIVRDGALTNDRLTLIDKITHSIKSIDTIQAMEDSGYSRDYSYPRGHSYRYDDRYSRNDGYSYDSDIKIRLNDLMHDAKSDREREAIRKAMDSMN